jgi:nucleotide-binding universal stress UspA family protein
MYKEILLPVDLNNAETQQKALDAAVTFAKTFGARLHVMTIVPDFGVGVVGSYFTIEQQQKALQETADRLHDYVTKQIPEGVDVQHIVAQGRIYDEILIMAKKTGVDLIVMASHRPELKDYLLGPNAARVVRHAVCSVLVVRE